MSLETPPSHAGTQPHPRRWTILWAVGIAQLMLILDVTVVAIALPDLGADLGLGRDLLTWVVSGYTLAFGGLLLLGGRAADLFGARRLVLTGIGMFAAASLLAGLAPNGTVLLAARIAQGLSAALLSPAALSVVVTTFEGEERNRALGIWSSLGGSGAALGVLVGGLLTAGPGWPWVFFVNVPVGVALILLLRVHLPAAPRVRAGGRLDLLGALLVTAATAVLLFALIGAGDRGWTSAGTLGMVGGAVVLYATFVLRERTAADPLMDLSLLTRRPVATGAALILVATAVMLMVFFLGTFYLQDYRGFGPLVTGLLFLPAAIATIVGAQATGRVIGRTGARPLGVGAALLTAAGLLLPVLIDATPALVVGIAIAGAGTGGLFVVASATALGQIEPERAGIASGIVSTFHEFGGSLGAAVVSSMAAAGIAGNDAGGFTRGFAAAAVVALVAAIVALLTGPRTQQL